MASDSRTAEREEERRLNMRTLVIASAGSAAAALLTSQLWFAGTWIAAALTPVIVSLVSELLNRPTERIARSLTSDRSTLPAAGGAGRPARPYADPLPERVPEESAAGAGLARPPARGVGSEAPVRVYRAGQAEPRGSGPVRSGTGPGARITRTGRPGMATGGRGPTTRRRKVAYGAVFGTAAIAFAIAVAALTLPELVAGGSVGKNDGRTTFFGGKKNDDRAKEQAPQDTTEDEQQPPDDQQQAPARPDTQSTPPTEEEPPPVEESPPEQAPAPGEPLPETTPAPPAGQP